MWELDMMDRNAGPLSDTTPVTPFDANSPDGLLVAAAVAGEEEAFAQLVSRYQGALLRAAISRLGRRELAEESVQETFLCAHRWLGTYDSRHSFRTWLWTILLNQCSRHGKRESRQGVSAKEWIPDVVRPVADASRLTSPLDQLLSRESQERVHQLLARLPEAQADALQLRFFGGLTFPEIAAAMQCSEAGAKNRVKSGLLKLAEWLKRSDKQPACRTVNPKQLPQQQQAGRLPNESGDVL
jgi:RNA polymerase sigma-70 factor (ECF subfamily)